MLIVFAAFPAREVNHHPFARHPAEAVYLRIDTIEQALRACATLPAGVVTEGYAVAYRIAEENLLAGATVIADCVNRWR